MMERPKTVPYDPKDECAMFCGDTDLNVSWRIPDSLVSARDAKNLRLAHVPQEFLAW
jgi:dTDP-4-dehydrorhamnose 3,5-epimerase-like enzyme